MHPFKVILSFLCTLKWIQKISYGDRSQELHLGYYKGGFCVGSVGNLEAQKDTYRIQNAYFFFGGGLLFALLTQLSVSLNFAKLHYLKLNAFLKENNIIASNLVFSFLLYGLFDISLWNIKGALTWKRMNFSYFRIYLHIYYLVWK